jgi:hypothetical protein
MTSDDTTSETDRQYVFDRRTLLQSAVIGGAAVGGAGLTTAQSRNGNAEKKGFPPSGITDYGRSVTLGDGRVRTFTTETPSGEPKFHGVEFDRAALERLPSGDELESAHNSAETDKYRKNGQAVTVHFKQSKQYFVPFPDADRTPFTFLGLNWNPGGHYGGKGAWLKPHFDIHFHMLDPATVDDVEGPKLPPYDTGNGEYTGGGPSPDQDGKVTSTGFNYAQLPEGYVRAPDPVADQRYITDMGEHTAPASAPELPGAPEKFSNTLIQGFIDVGTPNEPQPRLAFVEPMLTRAFLKDATGTRTYDIPQPEEYPHDQAHPFAYSVRDLPSKDAVAVVLEDFRQV